MVFSSVVFLYFFLPVTLSLYLLCGHRARNTILLVASLLFYAWGEAGYVLIMLASIASNYVFGLLLDRWQEDRKRKLVMVAAVIVNLGLLAFFKYTNFLVEQLNAFLPEPVSPGKVHLPIGISFFTFQALSYVFDVYRRKQTANRNLLHLGLFISLFPQLIAGPIVRYSQVASKLANRSVSWERVSSGIQRFIVGLGKKVLIANTVAVTADWAFSLPAGQLTCSAAWIGIVCYTLHIYFDFSGYSDMAIGLGRVLGFEFPENFNYPYISRSIREFWRRWHISLSTWFRDYLYIPLGGNRGSAARTHLNLLTVFFLCGLWHGASWNYVIWGLFHGMFLVLERTRFGKLLDRMPGPLNHLYVLLIVMVGWVFFKADTLGQALHYLGCMFGLSAADVSTPSAMIYLDPEKWTAIALGLIGSIPLLPRLQTMLQSLKSAKLVRVAQLTGLIVIMLLSSILLAAGTHNPFIYYRF